MIPPKPSLSEIDNVLESELRPSFAELESLRSKVIFRGMIFGILGAILAALILFNRRSLHGDPASFISMLFILLLPASWLINRAYRPYRDRFKKEIIRKAFHRFFPSLVYDPEAKIARDLYDEAKFFSGINIYSGNDYCEGKLGDVNFCFSELHCKYESGSGKNRTVKTIFRGFFFVGDFQRNFFFRTTIQPDNAENLLGYIGRGLQRLESGDRLVDLEDSEFEKLFVVTSDDQVEARYILTPALMEKIVDFRKRLGQRIHICFVNGKMFLAIETGRDYFEPKLFGEIIERRDLMEFIDMLSLLMGVAAEFLQHRALGANPPNMPLPPLPKPLVQQPAPEKLRLMPWLKRK
ncbi:MAG: DUF3137 domain-containing protein [Bdellovibrionota bacterium]